MQAWRGNDRQETANFKPMILSEIHAAGDSRHQQRFEQVPMSVQQALVHLDRNDDVPSRCRGDHCGDLRFWRAVIRHGLSNLTATKEA